jgi:hypothetical protein
MENSVKPSVTVTSEIEKIHSSLLLEIMHWFNRQIQQPNDDFYWYFRPAHNGLRAGFLICENSPENPEYQLLYRVDKTHSQGAIYKDIKEKLMSLPCIPN